MIIMDKGKHCDKTGEGITMCGMDGYMHTCTSKQIYCYIYLILCELSVYSN